MKKSLLRRAALTIAAFPFSLVIFGVKIASAQTAADAWMNFNETMQSMGCELVQTGTPENPGTAWQCPGSPTPDMAAATAQNPDAASQNVLANPAASAPPSFEPAPPQPPAPPCIGADCAKIAPLAPSAGQTNSGKRGGKRTI